MAVGGSVRPGLSAASQPGRLRSPRQVGRTSPTRVPPTRTCQVRVSWYPGARTSSYWLSAMTALVIFGRGCFRWLRAGGADEAAAPAAPGARTAGDGGRSFRRSGAVLPARAGAGEVPGPLVLAGRAPCPGSPPRGVRGGGVSPGGGGGGRRARA